jgi:tRNA threonylcarbamoyladenosine biosynthesis protein TsaB
VNVLAIDGALGGFSAALVRDGRLVNASSVERQAALESGLGLVDQLLRDAGVEGKQLDRLAVGIGPGSFTGLRIALAYAKSLAQAWRMPLVAISSFDLLEFGGSLERVLTVIVGRPGVISARYRDRSQVRRASGPIAATLRAVLPPAETASLPVIGAPEDVLAALAEAHVTVEPLAPLVSPPAAAAALAALSARPAPSPHEVRADYGEAPAAKVPAFSTTAEKRARTR